MARISSTVKAVTLFSNIGVGEALLWDTYRVELATDIDRQRCDVYRQIYPATHVLCGDITDPKVRDEYCERATGASLLIATPPCQGFSSLNRVTKDDPRNGLVFDLCAVVKRVRPAYVLIENVPEMLNFKIDGRGIVNLIAEELSGLYPWIDERVLDASMFGTPQKRKRAIVLMSRDGEPEWHFPRPTTPTPLTLRDAIGDLPPIAPYHDRNAPSDYHPLHYSPPISQYLVEKFHHIQEGRSAFRTGTYASVPFTSDGNGGFRPAKGFDTTYKRGWWDKPAYTLTAAASNPGSCNTLHPRDNRTFTILEAMRIMGLPDDWPLPHDLPYSLAMEMIGEGVPPKMVRALVDAIPD